MQNTWVCLSTAACSGCPLDGPRDNSLGSLDSWRRVRRCRQISRGIRPQAAAEAASESDHRRNGSKVDRKIIDMIWCLNERHERLKERRTLQYHLSWEVTKQACSSSMQASTPLSALDDRGAQLGQQQHLILRT